MTTQNAGEKEQGMSSIVDSVNWLAVARGYAVLMAVWFVLAFIVGMLADQYASPESKTQRFIMLGVVVPIGSCVAFVLYLAFIPVWGWINGK